MNESQGDEGRTQSSAADVAADSGNLSAGAMLRAARERQGVHIAVLAAAIKVSPRKLDALEGDRYQELPDTTFTRALAQTVCRALKIDAQPVLAKLPQSGPAPLDQVSSGLNTPYRERPGRSDLTSSMPPRPLLWAGAALLGAAALIALLPARTWNFLGRSAPESVAGSSEGALPAVQPDSGMASAPATAMSAMPAASAALALDAAKPPAAEPSVEVVQNVPAAAAPEVSSAVASRGATLTATDASWIEVIDGSGQTIFSRVVQPGEAVSLDGALPLRLKIGNARSTQLVFHGQPVDLEGFTRDNVARVELK